MLSQGFAAAWDTYLRAGSRLPPTPPPVTPRRMAGLAEVLDGGETDVVVLDAYGVLHVGGPALSGAAEAIADVRRRGLSLCVLTNDVTHEPEGVARGLAARGLDIRPDEVVSGRSLLPRALARVDGGAGWGVIAIHPRDIVARHPALTVVEPPADTDPAVWDHLQGFVLVDVFHWTPADLAAFRAMLARRPRPLIVPNPDVTCPYQGRLTIEPGGVALAAAETHGVRVDFLGKPFPDIYGLVQARFPGVDPARVLMVGDSPHTDILGARGVGFRCLLVETGLLQGQDVMARFAESGLWPEFVAPSIGPAAEDAALVAASST